VKTPVYINKKNIYSKLCLFIVLSFLLYSLSWLQDELSLSFASVADFILNKYDRVGW
jgi:hypothetical protein